MSGASWSDLASTYADLQGLYVYAQATNALSVVPGPFGFVPSETRAGNRTILAQVSTYLDRLGPTGDLGVGLISGDVTPERWSAVANAQGAALNTVLSNLEDQSGRVWNEVVVQTGKDVGITVTKALPVVGFGAGFALVIVLALYLYGGRR